MRISNGVRKDSYYKHLSRFNHLLTVVEMLLYKYNDENKQLL